MNRPWTLVARTRALAIVAAVIASAAGVAQARTFDGFNDHFNLGLSTVSGEVCEASRSFDDTLVAKGARVWSVTCRGVSGRRGAIYLFPASRAARLRAAWTAALATRADCPKSAGSAATLSCKSTPGGLDYVVLAPIGRGSVVVAEGRAAIADRLTIGQQFVAGRAPEPQAVAEQTAAVSQIAGSHGQSAAADEADRSPEARRVDAYRSGQDWRFEDAETVFGELANPAAGASASRISREEALYNLALNVSNKGRFSEADGYFAQADAVAATTGSNGFSDLALNYKAAHARNQGDYQGAIKFAKLGIEARRNLALSAVKRDPSGAIDITDSGGDDGLGRLTPRERRSLRDVQALEIEGTSQEALGQTEAARATLAEAEALSNEVLPARGAGGAVRHLGDVTPWLNTQVRGDILRLDRGTDRAPESLRQFRIAVNTFGQRYPGSLPLAGRLVELGRAEVSLARSDKGQADQALVDYESAFDIFRRQRGSIEASADLVRPYFDVLLERISAAPTYDGRSVERFFTAAQTLVSQSSAEAANRQAAQSRLGDEKTASLARRLDEVGRDRDAVSAEIRDLEQKGLYSGAAKARLDLEAKSLTETSAKLEGELEQADPRFASQLRTVVTLDELKKALRPGEVYVKVFLLAGRGYGVLVSSTDAKPYGIDLSREKALAMVTKLRDPIDRPNVLSATARSPRRYDVALAYQTFQTLFGPVRSEVLAAHHIIYEPDSSLIGAPLSALVVDDASAETMKANLSVARATSQPLTYAGVAWLGARASTSTALSAAAFVIARAAPSSRAPSPFYGFGDPAITQDPRAFFDVRSTTPAALAEGDFCGRVRAGLFHLQALPQTATEIKDVAASLGQDGKSYALGADFNDTDILRRGGADGDLSHYKVIYFATHGILPQPNGCMQSALLTSLGDGDSDALLDVKKIPKLHLDADMVVLSACDTGRSGDGRGGEALGGLVTTFVEAGARNVVVSNWEVDTNATVRLMKTMFADKGATQADALAVAERELMASPDQYSHPYFWASFTVVGDGARPMPAV